MKYTPNKRFRPTPKPKKPTLRNVDPRFTIPPAMTPLSGHL